VKEIVFAGSSFYFIRAKQSVSILLTIFTYYCASYVVINLLAIPYQCSLFYPALFSRIPNAHNFRSFVLTTPLRNKNKNPIFFSLVSIIKSFVFYLLAQFLFAPEMQFSPDSLLLHSSFLFILLLNILIFCW